ncbi:hypothetical protein [Nocardia sp. NPDC004604]|uniref:hypothetical protein n=1 Tax=Nocardia sp. NPDC004604 TaxID=3157013 RepID=UPI0033BAA6C3
MNEPGSAAWHAVRRAQVQPGERVLVVGGGSVGLLTAAAAQHQGHAVDVDARHRHQLAAAERLGFGRPNGDQGRPRALTEFGRPPRW